MNDKKYNAYPNGKRTLFYATSFALNGLKSAFKSEAAIRLEVICTVLALPIAYALSQSWVEFVVLMMPWLILICVELINTAIESTIDRISLEHHPVSKIVKDIASAAVFMAVVLLIFVWLTKVIWCFVK